MYKKCSAVNCPSENFDQAHLMMHLARAYRLKGNLSRAKAFCFQSISLYEARCGKDSVKYADAIDVLGTICSIDDQFERALRCHEHCISLWKSNDVYDRSKLARYYGHAGNILRRQRKFDDAIIYYNKAVACMESITINFINNDRKGEAKTNEKEIDDPKTAFYKGKTARVYVEMEEPGKQQIGIRMLLEAANSVFKQVDPKLPLVGKFYLWLGEAYLHVEEYDTAETHLKQALGIFEPDEGVLYANANHALAKVYERKGFRKEAEDSIKIALYVFSSINESNCGIARQCKETQRSL